MNNRELAQKIYRHLQGKGANLGNASILFIEEVLDDERSIDVFVKFANNCQYNSVSHKLHESNRCSRELCECSESNCPLWETYKKLAKEE